MVRPLTEQEATNYISKLEAWQSPSQFTDELDEVMEITGLEYLLLGKTEFREAHIARWCASEMGPQQLRLYPKNQGDFEFQFGGEIRRFEVTEAMVPGRLRNKEIKDRLAQPEAYERKIEHVDQEQMNIEDAGGRQRVIALSQKKAANEKYDFAITELVIYMNAGWTGSESDTFLKNAYEQMPEACSKFKRVWVYQNRSLIQISDDGAKCSMSWIDEMREAEAIARERDQTPLEELLELHSSE
ncbi:MAG: hypothetical protein MRY64_05265 [Hyphomonadaceae bacterium]|nr:hypothetical protein [Hyphomonadaceae bacterium]